MKYVKLYADVLRQYKRLSDAEFGRALRAVLQYIEDGTEANLPGKECIMYDVLREQVERDRLSYNAKVKNGKKGGRPKKTEGNLKNLMVISETEKTEKNQDKEKEYIPPYNPPTGEDDGDEESELLALSARHDEVFDRARECGFDVNTATLDRLTALIADHGPQAVLAALDECVEHGARTLAYLRKVLANRGKPPAQAEGYETFL